MLSPRLAKSLVERRLASSLPWNDAWISYRIRGARSVEHAFWLFRLGHDRLRGTSEPTLQARIRRRHQQRAESNLAKAT